MTNFSAVTYAMPMLWFSPPVPVKTKRVGVTREVNSVDAAAEELLTWHKRNAQWQTAVKACIAAKEGTRTPEAARQAFLTAAKACGMLRGQ
ncbi:DUF982 domain-containing protein [Mesorhizobium sp. CA13]|uniref:DUF982 domain-containing protein n=1 Tax=Mesorhizobium sp. CA13 TaxID=2876643 RepID=UPI001CCBFDC8|nr:DUF982 domain-containing protein [Mesorhizobium sp. CA13]MBZ9852775.1 DUF982 domain-containing protein [Mesorhizobium sp. CA13]